MSRPACEDADEIQKGLYRLRRLCFVKMGLTNTGCWCMNAGENGSHIPCAQAMSPMPIDVLGRRVVNEITKTAVLLSEAID